MIIERLFSPHVHVLVPFSPGARPARLDLIISIEVSIA